ncbi:MFS transporter [Nitrospirillum iridis]|uniref:MFS family permease n=1 Tax=Nitrospirillum iridis TaxID=765888 RepID=A0A7X0EEE9_9PROT|nr:MFS transporter [Nitrospirillum iridis]MBB6251986.1 MFS family permease [Nitrospirillum iridis]
MTIPAALPGTLADQAPRPARMTPAQARLLFAATMGNFMSATPVLYTVFGMALIPISQEFAWPRAQVAGVLGLAALFAALMAFVTGPLVDRYGPRRLILFGSLSFALALALFSCAPARVLPFYGLFLLADIAAAFASPMTFSKAVSGWFDRSRGAALGFAGGVGNGLGATIIPIVGGMLLSHFGWRVTYQGMALMVGVIGFPILLRWLRDPPPGGFRDTLPARHEAAPAHAVNDLTLRQAVATRAFWIMALAIGLCAACMTAMFTNVVPVLTERGFGLGDGVTVVTIFALVCAVWQWLMGLLLDRIARPLILVPFYLLGLGGLLLLQYGPSMPWLAAAGVLMGLGLGAEYSALPFLLSRYFGFRSYGAIAGMLYGGINVGMGLIPFAMNGIFDAYRSYDPALHIIQGLMLAATIAFLFLPPHDRPLKG